MASSLFLGSSVRSCGLFKKKWQGIPGNPSLQKKFVRQMSEDRHKKLLLWFNELSIDDVPIVGGKNASLGEMYRQLVPKGVNIPNGFAVSAYAYHYFVEKEGIKNRIRSILEDLDVNNINQLQKKGQQVRDTFMEKHFPVDLEDEIKRAYEILSKEYAQSNVDVAVRSSATAEDLPDASFAGQQETFLNIKGNSDLILACRKCMASLFTNRAISYRQAKGFDHFDVGLSIGVQKMVRSDKASSGVMFSIDTETGFQNAALITGSWGLGENIVQGAVNPDEWYVFKPSLADDSHKPIIQRKLGSKEIKMVYNMNPKDGETSVKNKATSKRERESFCISDDEVIQLGKWATVIEDHYSKHRGKLSPMDMEWAKDGETGQLFIVQARPETVHSLRDQNKLQTYVLNQTSEVITSGSSVGARIGSGKANVIESVNDIDKFVKGSVLVTEMTDPDWEPILKQASAVVTNRGGRTCHAAIISRELGIPCIVGTGNATRVISDQQEVTVDCSKGEEGVIWKGILPFEIQENDISNLPRPKTKIMVNIANPEKAFETSFLPNDGVGLARMEFIVSNYIKVHPLACLHPEKVTPKDRKLMKTLSKGYENPASFFVNKLSEGIGMIASSFYPKKVILRFSDFKTNEYANLIGGPNFEPKEENPMLGWRGASRYYDPSYKEGFALECKAVRKVRETYGLTNLVVMIPFCRTVEEAERVLSVLKENGLERGKHGLQVYGMCEVPSNVIEAEEFLNVLDGFSIGSNDLTQLSLGLDRDSETIRHLYSEQNPTVKRLISQVIKVAKEKGKYIGICGQGPSDFPDFAAFLVDQGIESMSLTSDTILKTTIRVLEEEKKLGRQKIKELNRRKYFF